MENERKIINATLRMPKNLNKYLKHRAVDNFRSLNSEIIARLEESKKQDKQEEDLKNK